MIKASPDQQRRLLELQATDTRIRQLEHRRTHLPEQQALDEVDATLTAVSDEFTANRDELSTLQVRQGRLEQEIATVDSRRKSEEGRMYGGMITSEKEVTALRHELSSLRARKSDLEDELLDAMERREELDGMVSTLKARHAELQQERGRLAEVRDAAAVDIDHELDEERTRRRQLADELPSELVAAYTALRNRKQGLGVAELTGRTCSGCRLELTASELEEVAADSKRYLATCPQCGRGLIPT